jgi:hypothetical protein
VVCVQDIELFMDAFELDTAVVVGLVDIESPDVVM